MGMSTCHPALRERCLRRPDPWLLSIVESWPRCDKQSSVARAQIGSLNIYATFGHDYRVSSKRPINLAQLRSSVRTTSISSPFPLPFVDITCPSAPTSSSGSVPPKSQSPSPPVSTFQPLHPATHLVAAQTSRLLSLMS